MMTNTTAKPQTVFEDEEDYFLSGRNFKARGHLTENGFIVFAGATIAPPCESFNRNKTYSELRSRLVNDEIIDDDVPETAYLTEDHIFKSVSQAACIIAGAILNGRDNWRTAPDEDGAILTFGEAHPRFKPKATRKELRRQAEERRQRDIRRKELQAIREMKERGVKICWVSKPGWFTEYRGHLPVPMNMIYADKVFA